MAQLKYVIRTHKGGLNKDGQSLIFLRYTHKAKVTYLSLGRTVFPEFFDKRNGKIKAGYKGFVQFNLLLDKFRQRIEDIVNQALSDEIDPTVQYLREKLNQKEEKKVAQLKQLDFYTYADQFIENSKINKKESTLKCYRRTIKCFKEYQDYCGEQFTWDSFDLEWYNDFKKYMVEVRDCGNNYFGNHIKTLKTICNDAIEKGYIINKEVRNKKFKVLNEDAENIYLNEVELKTIYDLYLSNNTRLEMVRDLFVVGCYTGLRFSDFSEIKPENIKDSCLYIRTLKTNQPVVIPFHFLVKEIMKKYEGKYPNSLPPSLPNQTMNNHLKEIGKLAGLNESILISKGKGSIRVETTHKKYELVCTHTARRSFATNLFKQGFSSINIMKITGHKTEKAFIKYIKVKEEESAQMLKNHWDTYYSKTKQSDLKVA